MKCAVGWVEENAAEAYPAAFWWVTVPAYFMWGVGLCIAAASYWVITRPPCRIRGLGRHGAPPTALRADGGPGRDR